VSEVNAGDTFSSECVLVCVQTVGKLSANYCSKTVKATDFKFDKGAFVVSPDYDSLTYF